MSSSYLLWKNDCPLKEKKKELIPLMAQTYSTTIFPSVCNRKAPCFITMTIKKTCTQGSRFNKISDFYWLSRPFLT
jgi:hypothetical protein